MGSVSSFMSPAQCRARAQALRAEALRKTVSDARTALLAAAEEYEKLAREIEKVRADEK